MTNEKRMELLTQELTDMGYEMLAHIFNEALEACPIFSAQAMGAQDFLNEVLKMLQGLTLKNLEDAITGHDELERVQQIVAQADTIKKALFISGDFVMVGNLEKNRFKKVS